MVVEVLAGIDLHGVAKCEILQAGRQLLGTRHPCRSDQHGNDRHTPPQRGFYLDPDRISLFLNTFRAALRGAKPTRADNGKKDVS